MILTKMYKEELKIFTPVIIYILMDNTPNEA